MVFLLLSTLASATQVTNVTNQWSEMFVRYDGSGPVREEGDYFLNDTNRTFLHIQNIPGQLSGVYIYAHGNGGDADISFSHRRSVINAGYAFISWESVTTIETPEDTLTCQSDHRKVMEWVVANAANYSLDTSNIIMGGRSRGSICSWPLAQEIGTSYTVKGIYMYGAFPLEPLFNESNPGNILSYVTTESPPLFLAYGPDCPEPIEQDCLPSPNPDDIHNPKYGQRVIEAYEDINLGPWANLKDGMQDAGIKNIMYYFPHFILTLPNATKCTAGLESRCSDYQVGTPQECAQCARANVEGLIKDDRCDITTVTSLCLSATGTDALRSNGDQFGTDAAMRSFIFDDENDLAAPTAAPTSNSAAAISASPRVAIFALMGALMLSFMSTFS